MEKIRIKAGKIKFKIFRFSSKMVNIAYFDHKNENVVLFWFISISKNRVSGYVKVFYYFYKSTFSRKSWDMYLVYGSIIVIWSMYLDSLKIVKR